jgi:hypothetical protein
MRRRNWRKAYNPTRNPAVMFISRQTAVLTKQAVDALPASTHNKMEEEDNESSESGDEYVPPLLSTHDFVAALESNTSNKVTGNEDSQLTTLSV